MLSLDCLEYSQKLSNISRAIHNRYTFSLLAFNASAYVTNRQCTCLFKNGYIVAIAILRNLYFDILTEDKYYRCVSSGLKGADTCHDLGNSELTGCAINVH